MNNNIDLTKIKPYGDTLNDGAAQVSFTLPLPAGDKAKAAAQILAIKMGLENPEIAYMSDLGVGYSFFILYGYCKHTVDFTSITISEIRHKEMSFKEINQHIKEHLGRKITVVGACTGTDAHTVGIDAIINMKGIAGEYGLERYPMINAYNLGSQVSNTELLAKGIELQADAFLVSQVVTQKNIHLENMTELVELAEAENIRQKILLIAGGPRISNELAVELGYDAGFGPGSLPNQVASFLALELIRRTASQKEGATTDRKL